MKRLGVAFLLALLALPASAQVEIRGLTIAPPDRPGNGGIMLKSVISTRAPGNISNMRPFYKDVAVAVDGAYFRLVLRGGELTFEPVTIPRSSGSIEMFYNPAIDLDGDGRRETVEFDKSGVQGRLVVKRQEAGSWREVASLPGFGRRRYAHFTDMTRFGVRQIVAIDDKDCLRVLSFADEALKDLGVLSCGAPLIGDPLVADVDGDMRYDLIVARNPDRIEIFLR